MDAAAREALLERLGRWLAALSEEEPLPQGLDPSLVDEAGAPPDLASLAAAVVAAAQESKLQGKAFSRLSEILGPLPDRVAELRTRADALPEQIESVALQAAAARHQDIESARRAGRSEALEDLLELHDRLTRTAAEARDAGARLSRIARWGGAGSVLAGTARGVELVLERLEEVLARRDVRRFETTGRPFDPGSMRSVDSVPAEGTMSAGTVATTLRAGFMQGERVLRPAEVRVAR
jgi:molecular chaperone GrpE